MAWQSRSMLTPWRLDMDWRWCERGLELGCLFSINPDAHATDEIDMVRWGVLMARKGGVPRERVLNSRTTSELEAHFTARRHRGGKIRVPDAAVVREANGARRRRAQE